MQASLGTRAAKVLASLDLGVVCVVQFWALPVYVPFACDITHALRVDSLRRRLGGQAFSNVAYDVFSHVCLL